MKSLINQAVSIEDFVTAAAQNNLPLLKEYLRLGMDPHSKNKDGITALHVAAQNGHADAVKIMLDPDNITSNTKNQQNFSFSTDQPVEQNGGGTAAVKASSAEEIKLKVAEKKYAIYKEKATTAIQEKNHQEALDSLNEAIRLHDLLPATQEMWMLCFMRADVLSDLQRYAEAIEDYKSGIESKPDAFHAHNDQGWCLYKLGKHQEAIVSYNLAIKIKPDYDRAYKNKSNALMAIDRFAEVVNVANEAIMLDPNCAETHCAKGFALIRLGKYKEAITSLDESIKLDPDFANAHGAKGYALIELKEYHKAILVLDKAIKLDPSLAEAHVNEADALINIGKFDEAIPLLRKAMEIKSDWAKTCLPKIDDLVRVQQLKAKMVELSALAEISDEELTHSYIQQLKAKTAELSVLSEIIKKDSTSITFGGQEYDSAEINAAGEGSDHHEPQHFASCIIC
jgi:tetratricopeptide (TPR) repeat protein